MSFNNQNPALIFTGFIVFVFIVWQVLNLSNFILFKDSNFQIYQLLTSSFLHLDFQHLISNAIWLLIISKFSERESLLQFSLMWFVFAIWWSLFSFVFEKAPVLWASWVVMWFFAYFYMKYKDSYDMSGLYVVLILNIVIWFLPWISLWGHLWWAVFWVLYYFIRRLLK